MARYLWRVAYRYPAVCLTLLYAMLIPTPAQALLPPEEVAAPRVNAYAQWHQQYLFLAARVPDTIVTGTNTGAMSPVEQDDAVEFDLEVPGSQGLSAHRLIVSCAGGMALLTRDVHGSWRADPSWVSGTRTLKFAAMVNGTINTPTDKDTGYTVEVGIPWEFLGGMPPVDREIGFNIVLWMQGENEGMVSWSSSVHEPLQIGDAARWGRMRISTQASAGAAVGDRIAAPYVGQTPFIDGTLGANEWMVASTTNFQKPAPAIELQPPSAEMPQATAFVAAIYRYDWQGGSEPKEGAPLWSALDGMPTTIDQPQEGAGPWVDYRSVAWQAKQLEAIQQAGIDIILARYSGTPEALATWSRTGLGRLSQALKQRRAQGEGYPLVGLLLDTRALAGVDLRTDEGCAQLYSMIRDFYQRIPAEFWAQLEAKPEQGLAGGAPVLLGDPEGLTGWDAHFAAYCQQRFAQDFSGGRIVWIGSSAWRREGLSFWAYLSLTPGTGFTVATPEGARAVAISPGYVPPPGQTGTIRPRMEGRTYRGDWQRALAAQPELVIINSWNDYENATEIAPSRQFGVQYVDLTRYFQAFMGSSYPHKLWLKQVRIPSVIAPGAEAHVELLLENAGTEDLETGTHVSVGYELTRRADGAVIKRNPSAQGLAIKAGQTMLLPVTIAAQYDNGEPLPPGDYLYTMSVTRSRLAYVRSSWIAQTIAELKIPCHVGSPPRYAASVISSSLPCEVEAGATENVVVRLRNDGRETWRKGQVQLGYRWIRPGDDGSIQLVGTSSSLAELPKDVPPGEVASVMVALSAMGEGGLPLPVVGGQSEYRVRWDLTSLDGQWFSKTSGPAGEEFVAVISYDSGVVLEAVTVAPTVTAGSGITATVTAVNAGRHTWGEGASVVWEWRRWDGRPAGLPSGTFPLPKTVTAGERVKIEVPLAAPPLPGPYRLAFSLTDIADRELTWRDGRRRMTGFAAVSVTSNMVKPVDLSPFMNVNAIATDVYRSRADFDGSGNSLPAEFTPPDRSGAPDEAYPSAYYTSLAGDNAMPFVYPDASAGLGQAVACAGQQIPLGETGAIRIHLALTSTDDTQQATILLRSASGVGQEMPLPAPAWDANVITWKPGLAFSAPFLRTLSGDDSSRPARVYCLTLTPAAPAIMLELPRAPWIKILAITVETQAQGSK